MSHADSAENKSHPKNGPYLASAAGLLLALVSGILSDVFGIFPHLGTISLLTFVGGIIFALSALLYGMRRDWYWWTQEA